VLRLPTPTRFVFCSLVLGFLFGVLFGAAAAAAVQVDPLELPSAASMVHRAETEGITLVPLHELTLAEVRAR
jgi:hypothetical protein